MNPSLEERVLILGKLQAAINLYYAHGQDAEEFDCDIAFRRLIPQALSAKDRYEFTLVMLEFFGSLHNGHCWYVDDQVWKDYGQQVGFQLGWSQGVWQVQKSYTEGLTPGDVVTAVAGEPMEDFFKERIKYLPVSTIRQARIKLTESPILWPPEFDLTLADGRVFPVKRLRRDTGASPMVTGRWLEEGRVGYVQISSFGLSQWEEEALNLVKGYKGAEAIIVDVRDNNGGATPEKLIRYLMDRPYRGWTESSPIHIGLIRFICQYVQKNPSAQSMAGPLLMFNDAHLNWRSPLEKPEEEFYPGRLLILIGPCCRSAGEDFVQPFKDNGRAILLGQTTFGSTGQPWFHDFGNGIRVFIGTKRAYFADGSPFEGLGIAPDISVTPTREDLALDRDIVLEKALELALKEE